MIFFNSTVWFSCSDVEVEMPDTLDLATLRGQGLQSSEEELPEGTPLVVPGRVHFKCSCTYNVYMIV